MVQSTTDIQLVQEKEQTKNAWTVFIFVFLGWALVNFSNVYSLISADMAADLNLSIGSIGVVTSVYSAGGFVSSLWLPVLADKKGRRLGMSISIAFAAIFNGLLGTISSIFQVFGFRFIAAHGQTCQWGIGAAYLSEMVPAKNRGSFLGAMQSGTPVGTFLLSAVFAMVTTLGWGWRQFSYVGLIGLILIPFMMLLLKESPQWFAAKEARESAIAYEKDNKVSISELFIPKYRKYTFIAMALHVVGAFWAWGNMTWFTVAMRTDFNMTPVDMGKMNMLLWGTAIIGYPLMGKVSDKIGRKKGMLLASSMTVLGCSLIYFASQSALAASGEGSTLLYVAAIIVGFGMGQHSVLIAYSSEIFPSHVRATGTSLAIGVGRASAVFTMLGLGMIAQALSPSTAELIAALGGWLMVPIVWIFGEETAGKELSEIIE